MLEQISRLISGGREGETTSKDEVAARVRALSDDYYTIVPTIASSFSSVDQATRSEMVRNKGFRLRNFSEALAFWVEPNSVNRY